MTGIIPSDLKFKPACTHAIEYRVSLFALTAEGESTGLFLNKGKNENAFPVLETGNYVGR